MGTTPEGLVVVEAPLLGTVIDSGLIAPSRSTRRFAMWNSLKAADEPCFQLLFSRSHLPERSCCSQCLKYEHVLPIIVFFEPGMYPRPVILRANL